MLNLTICAFLPHVSITGPIETQRRVAQITMEASAEDMAENRKQSFVIVIIIGVGGLLACGAVASITAVFLSVRVKALVNFMEKLRSKLSNLVDEEIARVNSTALFCKPLPADFFPDFGTTPLKDVNEIIAATNDLCSQLLKTWNTKQEAFKQALEQRQFTASIAHDIRNPLHGVLGIVSMMQSNVEAHKDKLPLLADTLQHMAILLNDMVDLSKIQGGKVAHVLKRFDAWNSLEEVVSLYRDTVESSRGTLSCMERTPLPAVYSDPVHVQRIMTNFVSNASKYAAGCDVVLKAVVATRRQVRSLAFLHDLGCHFSDDAPCWAENGILEDDEYIVLACLDKGRGIPPCKLDKIFDAYQQTRDSDRCRGAGLGLAIVKGLAVEMGGGVGVQSQVGSGSLFWLVVTCTPTEVASEQALPPPKEKSLEKINPEMLANPPAPQPGLHLTGHVLVVDDTNLNLMLLKHFLAKLGIKAEASTSAMDGLNKLREDPNKFSLILSDFNMPEMTGGEMCLEVRKDQRLCHLPFICTSGNLLTEGEKEKYKIDDTMMKPFTLDQLRETIRPYIQLSDESVRLTPKSYRQPR
jgi:two-component system, sensor histidine kinase